MSQSSILGGKIRKPGISNSMTYGHQNSRKSNFATEPKSVFQQLYEALAGGVSEVLENIPRREVAAQADIAGPLDNPQASTWQVVVTLIQNAFFKAILPGFERERGRGDRGPSERSARPGAR
jgi:hypothetical protein